MLQPKKWLIGLPLIAVLFLLAAAFGTQPIEDDIAARVRAGLAESTQALADPRATASGRDVSVSGFALSESAKEEAFAEAGRQPGVRKVLDATAPLPAVKPFVFIVERAGKRVTLGGNLPPTGRDKIKAAAAAIGAEASDNAGYASGAPRGFADLATFAVAQVGRLDPGKVTLEDDTLSISGQAKTSTDYEKALAALKSPPAGAVVATVDISAPRMSPYVWSAANVGDAIALTGSIPSNDLRAGIAAKAASIAGSAKVADETHVGGGAPSGDFAAAVDFALTELGKLTRGKATLTDAKLAIEGAGRENVSAASIEADARADLPRGFELARADVAAGPVSPYVLAARKSGATLTLSGYAPDDATRQKIDQDARRRFFDVGVMDELAIAKGAPKNFAEATSASLHSLARLSEGSARISGTQAVLEGAAFYEKAAPDVQSEFARTLPEGFKGEAHISARTAGLPIDAAQCRKLFGDILSKARISFEPDNATISADSIAALDALAGVALRCAGVAIEVSGHAESGGVEEVDRDVSKRRAQAVVDYLTKAGVDPFKMTAVGYGAQPVAASDSEKARAGDGRIDIQVK